MVNKAKRKTKVPCTKCFLHKMYCICDDLRKISLKTRVDLVVHYKELKRTTNTGRLIKELLENQNIWVRGEQGQEVDYKKILNPQYAPLLLYPSDGAENLTVDFLNNLDSQLPIQLIVPDGNWRQASKVHYRVQELMHVPRVKLSGDLADRVDLVRQESKPSGMSTLESIGHALGVLEGDLAQKHILSAYGAKKKATLKARGVK